MKNDEEAIKGIQNCTKIIQEKFAELESKLELLQQAQEPEKTEIQLEHNQVYRMSDDSVMQARRDVGKVWAMRELKGCGEEWVATENGEIYNGKGTHAVKKIGKMAVVPCRTNWALRNTIGNYYDSCFSYEPESLTGKKL